MTYYHSELTQKIIGAAIEIHRELGPGLLESIYESCMGHELRLNGLGFERQVIIPATYKGFRVEGSQRVDPIVEKSVVVELKVVEKINPVHEAQILTYLRLTGIKVGLLINFNEAVLKDGIRRMVL